MIYWAGLLRSQATLAMTKKKEARNDVGFFYSSLRGKAEAIQPKHKAKYMAGYFYIMFSERNGTLYVGVTSDLVKRVYEHKDKTFGGFSAKYGTDKLGYYEIYDSIEEAIKREKAIKGSSRARKMKLIESVNENWDDLYETLLR